MPNQPIPVATAQNMIKDYYDYMKSLGVDMDNQTQSVSFTGSTLMTWLGNVMPHANELRIFMGRYPTGHAHAGRTTVILWPYQNGQPANDGSFGGTLIPPFNEGSGQP